MYVKFDIPEINAYHKGFPSYWLKVMMVGTVSTSYQVNALASTYVRLVEASLVEYRLAYPTLMGFWDAHDGLKLSAMHRAISHFETCLTNMHRAIVCFVRLRRHADLPENLKLTLNQDKPRFVANTISDQLRDIRNAVHHLEERVMKGDIREGECFVLSPDGEETAHEYEPGQTNKLFDRLIIGSLSVKFSDLAAWLTELAYYAEKLSEFEPCRNGPFANMGSIASKAMSVTALNRV
jgi:hypothetical protein